MKIAVVILNWNGKKLLETFLPAVIAHSQGAAIYVVDNASTDGSVAFVKAGFKAVKVIEHQRNYGYAEGYNRALKQIRAEVYCLLNSDVEVTENWLAPFYALFGDSKVAIAQPKILDYKRRDRFEYAGAAGGFMDRLGYPYCRGRVLFALERDRGQYDDKAPIFWVGGACFFIRSTVFHELKGFDEDYFAYQEEVDLCWRAQHRGYKAYCMGRAAVYHVGGATLGHLSPKKTFLNFRNSLFNLVKNLPARRLPSAISMRLVLDCWAALYFLSKGEPKQAWAVLRAHLSFYKNCSKIYRKRRDNPDFTADYYRGHSIVLSYFILKRRRYETLY